MNPPVTVEQLEQVSVEKLDLNVMSDNEGCSSCEDDCPCDDQGCVGDDDSCGEVD